MALCYIRLLFGLDRKHIKLSIPKTALFQLPMNILFVLPFLFNTTNKSLSSLYLSNKATLHFVFSMEGFQTKINESKVYTQLIRISICIKVGHVCYFQFSFHQVLYFFKSNFKVLFIIKLKKFLKENYT